MPDGAARSEFLAVELSTYRRDHFARGPATSLSLTPSLTPSRSPLYLWLVEIMSTSCTLDYLLAGLRQARVPGKRKKKRRILETVDRNCSYGWNAAVVSGSRTQDDASMVLSNDSSHRGRQRSLPGQARAGQPSEPGFVFATARRVPATRAYLHAIRASHIWLSGR